MSKQIRYLKHVMTKKPTVIDFFCGAGGFSEGFRQQGFEVIAGYDNWKPAIDSFNFNFGEGKGILYDLLKIGRSIKSLESLPDSQVILGSPPCVSFSLSNYSGKADKSMGKRLTTIFLKIVAIKKHKKGSILEAWFMENVVQSIDHVSKDYTFRQLGLKRWAERNGYDSTKVALSLKENHTVMNAADYGCPQQRIRAVAGEVISKRKLVIPKAQFADGKNIVGLQKYLTLGQVKERLPAPNATKSNVLVYDPLYKTVAVKLAELTDHFYDTGLYESEWMNSKFLKTNHPFMGKMSFPEKEDKPSRTITATRIGTSREAIIYRSEYGRKGHGQFRIPTVRESATLMGFPIHHQFIGGTYAKCRLVGNAVSPAVSRALAVTVRTAMGLPQFRRPIVRSTVDITGVPNLNSFKRRKFDSPPKKKLGATFRRHPFKDGNITVTLSNYDIIKDQHNRKKNTSRWITSVQYGNGEGYPCHNYRNNYYKKIEGIVKRLEHGPRFIEVINNGFSEGIAGAKLLQQIHEEQRGKDGFLTPVELLERIATIVNELKFKEPDIELGGRKVFKKDVVPKKQILALYAINKISSVANQRS
jgi:DNA (cytosine-5)-methyltransferase 1